MKNSLSILGLLLLAVSAHAQNNYYNDNKNTKVTAGIEAGANMTNMTHEGFNMDEVSTTKVQYNFKAGMRLGAVVNVDFKQRVDLRTGIYYSVKGASKLSFSNPFYENEIYGKMALNYLELPVNIFVHVCRSRNLYLGGGGYAACAVGGHYKFSSTGQPSKLHFTDEKKSNYSPTRFERLDYGLQAAVGYQFARNLFVQAQISKGMANAASDENYIQPYSYKNWGFSFTAGWLLRKR